MRREKIRDILLGIITLCFILTTFFWFKIYQANSFYLKAQKISGRIYANTEKLCEFYDGVWNPNDKVCCDDDDDDCVGRNGIGYYDSETEDDYDGEGDGWQDAGK